MKKTLSHICVLLPLALVLAACEPETRVVEKQVEVEVTRIVEMPVEVEVSRVVEMPVEVEVSRVVERIVTRVVEKPVEETAIQPATDDASTPTRALGSGGGLPISSKRRPAGISLRFEWPRLSPTSHRRRSGIELVVSR